MGNVLGRKLLSYLTPYIDDASASQVDFFNLDGTKVSMKDVFLKPEVLNKLTVRSIFRVFHGYIRSIEVDAPWSSLLQAARGSGAMPISIKVSDIYIVAVPNSAEIYNAEDQARYEWEMKKSLLYQFETFRRKMLEEYLEKKTGAGRYDNLVPSLIKHAHVTISNVHVCFEDGSTLKDKLFHVGLIFSKLEMTNETNEEKKPPVDEEYIAQKKVKIESFAVYLNSKKVTQLSGRGLTTDQLNEALKLKPSKDNPLSADTEYILCPREFTASAILNNQPDKCTRPLYDVRMDLPKFDLQLTNHQVTTLRFLAEALDRIYCGATYLKWRPKTSIQEDPLAWWQFMYEAATQTGIGRQKEERSWKKIEETCAKFKKYQEMFKQKLLDQKIDATVMEQYERELNLTTLMVARRLAEHDVKKDLVEIWKKKAEKTNEAGFFSSWVSWFSWSSSSDDQQQQSEEDKKKLESLKNELDNVEKELRQVLECKKGFQKYSKQFITMQAMLVIGQFRMAIKRETETLLDVELKQLAFKLTNREASENTVAECTLDQVMILGCDGVKILRDRSHKGHLLAFALEMNPLDKPYNFDVKLDLKRTLWQYDAETIKQLSLMLAPPKGLTTEIQTVATNKMYDFSTGIERALLKKQKQLKLTIKMEPSFIVIPQGVVAQSKAANPTKMLLSFGGCTITSELLDGNRKEKLMQIRATTEPTLEAVKPLIYQKFNCRLKNVQLAFSDEVNWKKDMEQPNTERHLILPFDVALEFHRSTMPKVVQFPKVMITAEIQQIRVITSDTQIWQLQGFIQSLIPGSTEAEKTSTAPDEDNTRATRLLTYTADECDAYNVAYEDDGYSDMSDTSSTTSEDVDTEVGPQPPPFKFTLEHLNLDLYSDNRKVDSMFAKVCLEGLSAQGDIFCEGETIIEVTNLRLTDTRMTRKKAVRKIFEKSSENNEDDSKLFKVVIRPIPEDILANAREVVVNMASTISTLELDYIELFQKFAATAFAVQEGGGEALSNQPPATTVAAAQPNSPPPVATFNFLQVCISKTQVIMMKSLEKSVEGLIGVFSCSANLEVKMTQMVFPNAGTLYLVDVSGPVGIHFGIANYLRYRQFGRLEEYVLAPIAATITASFKKSEKSLGINIKDPVDITISPEIVGVLLSLVAAANSADSSSVQVTSTIDDTLLGKPVPLDPNVWYLKTPAAPTPINETEVPIVAGLTVQMLRVQVKPRGFGAQALLRLDASLQLLQLNSQIKQFKLYLTAHYYSTLVGDWEPLVEPSSGPGGEQRFVMDGTLNKTATSMSLSLVAKSKLEILITKSFFNTLNAVTEAFQVADTSTANSSFKGKRLIIRNSLGIPLNFEVITSEDGQVKVPDEDATLKMTLNPGAEYYHLADNLSKTILLVNQKYGKTQNYRQLHFKGVRNSIRSLWCHNAKEGIENAKYLWIEQVIDSELSLTVDYSSNVQFSNHFDVPFDLHATIFKDGQGTPASLGKLRALGRFPLPLIHVYHARADPVYPIFVCPSEEYKHPTQNILWPLILSTYSTEVAAATKKKEKVDPPKKQPCLTVSCQHKKNPDEVFQLLVTGEKMMVPSETVGGRTNPASYLLNIKLIPFAKMRNLLPYEVQFKYVVPAKVSFSLKSGEEKILPFVDLEKGLPIAVKILNYFGCKEANGTVKFPTQLPAEPQTQYFEFTANRHKFKLPVKYCLEGGTTVVTLYASFWVFNETRLPFTLFTPGKKDRFQVMPADQSTVYRSTEPFLVAFEEELKKEKKIKEAKNIKEPKDTKDTKDTKEAKATKDSKETKEAKKIKEPKDTKDTKETKEAKETKEKKPKFQLALRLHTYHTSDYFDAHHAPSAAQLTVKEDERLKKKDEKAPKSPGKGNNTAKVYLVIEAAPFALTKILRISSFCKLYNFSKYKLELSGPYWENDWKENKPFESLTTMDYFPPNLDAPAVELRFASSPNSKPSSWSKISLKSSQRDILLIDGRPLFVEVEVCMDILKISDPPFVTVKLRDFEYGQATALIVNQTKETLLYGQKDTTSQVNHAGIYPLKEGHSVFHRLINSAMPKKLAVWKESDKSVNLKEWDKWINLDDDQALLLYKDIYCFSLCDGLQRVVLLTSSMAIVVHRLSNPPTLSVDLTMDEVGINLVDDESASDLLYLSIRPSVTWFRRPLEEEKTEDKTEDKAKEKTEEEAEGEVEAEFVYPKETARLEEVFQWYQIPEENRPAPRPHADIGHFETIKTEQTEAQFWMESNIELADPLKVEYLRYASTCGLTIRYYQCDGSTQYEALIFQIQIDDQLLDRADNSLVLYSLLLVDPQTKMVKHSPFLYLKVIASQQGTVTHYKSVQVDLLQRLLLQVHLSWVYQICNFFAVEEKNLPVAIGRVLQEASKNFKADQMVKEDKMYQTFLSNFALREILVMVYAVQDKSLEELIASFNYVPNWLARFIKNRVNFQNIKILLAKYPDQVLPMNTTQLMPHLMEHYYNVVYNQKIHLFTEIAWNWKDLVSLKCDLAPVHEPRFIEDIPHKSSPLKSYQAYLEEGTKLFNQLKKNDYFLRITAEESYSYHVALSSTCVFLLTNVRLIHIREEGKTGSSIKWKFASFKWTNIVKVNKTEKKTLKLTLKYEQVDKEEDKEQDKEKKEKDKEKNKDKDDLYVKEIQLDSADYLEMLESLFSRYKDKDTATEPVKIKAIWRWLRKAKNKAKEIGKGKDKDKEKNEKDKRTKN